MIHAGAHIYRYMRLLVVLGMLIGSIGWTTQASATASCNSSSATLSMPASVSIPVNAPAGPVAGASGTATIIVSCAGLPQSSSSADHTATVQTGQYLATLDSTNVTTGPGIRFATNVTGLAILVTATPVQATSQACLECGPTSTAGYVPGKVSAPTNASLGSYSGTVTANFTAQLVKTIAGPITPGTINAISLIPFWWYVSGGSAHSTSENLNTALKFSAMTVTVPACSISTPSFGVTLPTVSTRALASSAQVAGRTAFSIGLSGCPSGVSTITNTFSLGSIDASTGYLKNATTSGSATNVEVQLLNGAGGTATAFSPIILNAATATSQNSSQFTVVGGAAKLNYYAQYIATGVATIGSVATSVQYTITYP